MGVSMGGMIAAEYALAYGGDLKSLTLACTYGKADPFCQTMFAMWADLAKAVERALRHARRGAVGIHRPVLRGARRRRRRIRRRDGRRSTCRSRPISRSSPSSRSTTCSAAPAEIKVPTLVVAGEEDILIPVRLSKKLQAAIPGAKWKTVPGGHACMWETPDPFNTAFLDFVRSN